MRLLTELRDKGQGQDMGAVVAAIPYASFLGVEVQQQGNEVITVLPFADHLVGNPILPAIHGGVIGAFLEITSVLQLLFETACERLPKTVDVNFDYLRSGQARTTYGRAIVNNGAFPSRAESGQEIDRATCPAAVPRRRFRARTRWGSWCLDHGW